MTTVLFRVSEPKAATAVLKSVLNKVAPKFVDRLYPDAKNPTLASKYYVSLEESTEIPVASRIEILKSIPGISNVEIAADRHLID